MNVQLSYKEGVLTAFLAGEIDRCVSETGSPELTRPASRPARSPPEIHSPAPPEPSRLNFHPAASSPKGTRRPAHRNPLVPAPARPRLPRKAPAARHTGTHSSQLPPGPGSTASPPPPGTPELIRPSPRPALFATRTPQAAATGATTRRCV